MKVVFPVRMWSLQRDEAGNLGLLELCVFDSITQSAQICNHDKVSNGLLSSS